jgi:hypothetical protein
MQKVCDVLEKLLADGAVEKYAIGGATGALLCWATSESTGIAPGCMCGWLCRRRPFGA